MMREQQLPRGTRIRNEYRAGPGVSTGDPLRVANAQKKVVKANDLKVGDLVEVVGYRWRITHISPSGRVKGIELVCRNGSWVDKNDWPKDLSPSSCIKLE